MAERKYLSVGSIKQFEKNDAKGYPFIELDAFSLKEFVEFLTEFGKKHLAGKDIDAIKAGQKDKSIPRIQLSIFDPNDNAPEFIKKNIALKLRD